MNRITKTLALAAVVLAGAFGATAAQASAANFNVDFKVHNGDSTYSMIRETTPLPTGISGLINPPSAIAPGGDDPGTGNAVWTGSLPNLNQSVSVNFGYGRSLDNGAQCTFTMKITRDSNPSPYLLQLSASNSACSVSPSSARSADGQFTSTTAVLNWQNS